MRTNSIWNGRPAKKVVLHSVKRTVGGSTTNQLDADIAGSPAKALIALGKLTGNGPYTFNIIGKPAAPPMPANTMPTTVVHLARLGEVTFTGVTEAASGYDLNWDALDHAAGYSAMLAHESRLAAVSDNKVNFNIPATARLRDIAITALAGIDATGHWRSHRRHGGYQSLS